MDIQVYRNESFDLITSSTLISIFNDDLFLLFDHNRWDGKVEQGTITPFSFCYVHHLVVSEFILYLMLHIHIYIRIRSVPLQMVQNDKSKNEQIKSMLRVIDRIALKTSQKKKFLLSHLLIWNMWWKQTFSPISFDLEKRCLTVFETIFFLLHHINNNLSYFFHPIVNCTHTYQVDSMFIKEWSIWLLSVM